MSGSNVLSPQEWARQQFGEVELGDVRRTNRAVALAAGMARHPAASLPGQTGSWAGTKAAYRLFSQEEVTLDTLESPHWHATRQESQKRREVLMIQDTTELDFTLHWATRGLGPIGDGNGRGFLLHSTLAVDPEGVGEVLGLAYQMVFCRQPKPEQETRTERKHRQRESHIWARSVREIGVGETDVRWIHVCDRGADNFEMFEACRQTGSEFLIRVVQNRRAGLGHEAEQPCGQLLELARSIPACAGKELSIRSRPKRKPRRAKLSVAFAPVTIFPPWLDRKTAGPLRCWVVRVWETDPPPEEEAIEWVLLTSVPVEEAETALTVIHWYSLRWLVEEYHKCLKTGCATEKRQLQEADRLEACVGVLVVVAVRLLQLKLHARAEPNRPATECAPRDHVEVLAAYRKRSVEGWSVSEFWREVAKLGGFLGRKSDGEPGWQTLWRGWQKLDLMTLGARLARSEVPKCG